MNQEKYPNLAACDPLSCAAARINACERVVNGIYRKYFAPFDISISQYTILMVTNKMGRPKQVDLSDMLIMEKSTVNRNLKRLLERKLIRVQAKKRISITTKGKEKLESMIPEWEKAQHECAKKLKKEGLDSLAQLFRNLVTSS